MQNVPLPDSIYAEAARAAAATGLSLELFVAEAVQLHVAEQADEALILTPEQISIVRRSQDDIRSGRGMTMEQAKESLADNKASWLKTHHR